MRQLPVKSHSVVSHDSNYRRSRLAHRKTFDRTSHLTAFDGSIF